MKVNKKPHKQILIIGSIDNDNFKVFCEEMTELEKTPGDIHITLCSEGGDSYVGLAYYGRIVNSSCRTIITVYGMAFSAATIILAAGNHRIMHADSYFMVHDEECESSAEFQHMEVLETHWASILARHSNLSKQEWRQNSKETTYLNAQECLKIGLIDAVVCGPA